MKRLTIFLFSGLLFSVALHAADYYVSSGGNDSNDGSQGSPWLTLQHAVSSVACGDTINVVANGSYVAGDVTLPYFANCGQTTTIQSSALNLFAPVGYRTNPANDSANYGKLQLNTPILAAPGVYTFNPYYIYSAVSVDTSTSTFIVTPGNGLTLAGLANGSQVEFEVSSQGANYGGPTYPTISAPGGLAFLTHYYVINCSVSPACGAVNSTFQLSATSGGTPLSITSCGLYCPATVTVDPSGACTTGQIQYNPTNNHVSDCRNGSTWQTGGGGFLVIGMLVSANTSASTLTMPVNWGSGSLSNGLAVTFSAGGLQLVGTLPAPLETDQIYYVVNLSGLTFQLSTAPGGTPITLTTIGTGMTSLSSANVPYNWAFRGLEIKPSGTAVPYQLLTLGNGYETTIYSKTHNMEVDRCYLHDNPPTQGLVRAIAENGSFIYIHDSWITGANLGESQAILGTGSPGPTTIVNNFLEAGGEVTMYGGDSPAIPIANADKLFTGNYYYKPPVWKQTQSTGRANGACLYDSTDPAHAGGEWYLDTSAAQQYQCGADSLWHTTASSPAVVGAAIKNMAEHKNGRYFTYVGNLFNYSWAQAQSGEIFNNSMELGSGPGFANDHITVMNNAAFNSFQFSLRTQQCYATSNSVCLYTPGTHTTVNNLMVVNPLACGVGFTTGSATCGYHAYQTNAFNSPIPIGDVWNHNTLWSPDSFPFSGLSPMFGNGDGSCAFPPQVNGLNYLNNIVPGDFTGDCFSRGGEIAAIYTNSAFANNAVKGGTIGGYGSVGMTNTWVNNAYPAVNATIGYVNGTGTMAGDYHLSASSPYSASNGSAILLATDGTDLGADIDLINMATSGAAAGTPPWDQAAGLRVDTGSSQVVFRYTAPTAEACTATIYRAAARIPANQVAVATDGSANSISDALARELYLSGLQPSTRYWYKLTCGGGVLLVGTFLTQAQGVRSVAFSFDWSSPTPMQYSSSRSMSNPVSLPAATRQVIPAAANSVVYAQVGASGPITILIAP